MSVSELRNLLAIWDGLVEPLRNNRLNATVVINGITYTIERFPYLHRNWPQPLYRAVYRVNGKRVSKDVFYGQAA